jgi:hypothetical protein
MGRGVVTNHLETIKGQESECHDTKFIRNMELASHRVGFWPRGCLDFGCDPLIDPPISEPPRSKFMPKAAVDQRIFLCPFSPVARFPSEIQFAIMFGCSSEKIPPFADRQ